MRNVLLALALDDLLLILLGNPTTNFRGWNNMSRMFSIGLALVYPMAG
ncbi:MAG TPA: hypothetical protein V6D29_19225 [Leptolyngbyaceae cyanobacterium]